MEGEGKNIEEGERGKAGKEEIIREIGKGTVRRERGGATLRENKGDEGGLGRGKKLAKQMYR